MCLSENAEERRLFLAAILFAILLLLVVGTILVDGPSIAGVILCISMFLGLLFVWFGVRRLREQNSSSGEDER